MPPAADQSGVVAIVNSNDDLVNILRDALQAEGFRVVTTHIRDIKAGRENFVEFLLTHEPRVVIYDIAVPYEDNWTFFTTLRELIEAKDREFIITTVNKRVMEQRLGAQDVLEIQGGHADDLDPVIEAVKERMKSPRGVPAPVRRRT